MTAAVSPVCPLCDGVCELFQGLGNRDAYGCRCARCGKFVITEEALFAVREGFKEDRYLISAISRRAAESGKPLEITTYVLPEIIKNAPRPATPHDVLDPLLLAVHSGTKVVGNSMFIAYDDYPKYVLRGHFDLATFLKLLGELGLIDVKENATERRFSCRLTLKGWDRVADLRRAGRSSKQAFVAMSFAPELDPAWQDGFSPALHDAGWQPVRMDRLEHNERIDDRIIAEIRRSGLLVADFTGQRAGVYFEAGLGLGLGIPVIWTVHKPELAGVHFDTRQYNHIDWADPADLRTRLHDRIVASVTVPHRDAT